MKVMKFSDCASFADAAIEAIQWPDGTPALVKPALELAAAWAAAKWERGDYGNCTPVDFARYALDRFDNGVCGHIDLLGGYPPGPAPVREAFRAGLERAFALAIGAPVPPSPAWVA